MCFNFSIVDQNFYRMTAFDSDQKGTANSEVVYSLTSQRPQLKLPLFIIDPFSGYMSITQCLDYEVLSLETKFVLRNKVIISCMSSVSWHAYAPVKLSKKI